MDVAIVTHNNAASPKLDAAAGWLTPTFPGSELPPVEGLGQDVGYRAQESGWGGMAQGRVHA